eukprot:12738727-Prorocentrum_lima.AAC.1
MSSKELCSDIGECAGGTMPGHADAEAVFGVRTCGAEDAVGKYCAYSPCVFSGTAVDGTAVWSIGMAMTGTTP